VTRVPLSVICRRKNSTYIYFCVQLGQGLWKRITTCNVNAFR